MSDRGSEWRRWDLHVHTPESALAKLLEGGRDPFKTREKRYALKA